MLRIDHFSDEIDKGSTHLEQKHVGYYDLNDGEYDCPWIRVFPGTNGLVSCSND